MSGQFLDSVRTVSEQYQDSVPTVSGQCLKGVWKVFETEIFVHTFFAKLSPSGQCLDSAWTVSNYVKTVSGQCLNIIRTVSERCLESI